MKGVKLAIFLGITLVAAGAAFVGVAYATHSFKGAEIVTNEHKIESEFKNFDFDIDTANVEFVSTTEDSTKVTCIEKAKCTHEVSVVEDKLFIKTKDERKWYEKIFNFAWEEEKITIALPKSDYDNLKVEASTGNVKLNGFNFETVDLKISTGNLYLSTLRTKSMNIKASTGNILLDKLEINTKLYINASTGNIKLNDVKAENVVLDASTGNILLTNVLATNNITIDTSTGDVTFKDSDATTLKVKCSTGNVRGNLLTPKTFHAKASTGKVNVPDTEGGDCTIETSTGNINIEIK